ncbi:recombinase family protein [Halobium salinum]|uniref:Recombinase family protein n=1 Tax=Halobium salinum TaxID=1364940 RepID=A0ABD5P6N7_9EURY|nr:recombinase family protein [Halobium salinum]
MAELAENSRIAAYIRVSTERQKEEESHIRQKDTIKAWAERRDIPEENIDFYEDIAISGQSENRDDYNDLMDTYPEYDAIVVRELSRFGRDLGTIVTDVDEITNSDTEFVSTTEQFDTSSAMGSAMLGVIAVMNQLTSDLARERAERMHERRKEQGLPVGRKRKLDDKAMEDVYKWREMGMSYSQITALVSEMHGVDVDRSTIYRYCDKAGVEPEAET